MVQRGRSVSSPASGRALHTAFRLRLTENQLRRADNAFDRAVLALSAADNPSRAADFAARGGGGSIFKPLTGGSVTSTTGRRLPFPGKERSLGCFAF